MHIEIYLYELLIINVLYMPTFNYMSNSKFKCFNTFVNDFLPNLIPLLNNGFFQKIEIAYSLALVCRSPQIPNSTGIKSGLIADG